jgi:HAD superfamily hydrolase (TIGR01450 family)
VPPFGNIILPRLRPPFVPNPPPPYTRPVLPSLSDFPAILLDLDGTVYHEEHALPGAIELIRKLQAERRTFACLSNSTSSPQRAAERLARMGVIVPQHAIYTAGAAAADYILATWPGPRVFNLGTDGLHDLLDGKVRWVTNGKEPCDVIAVATPVSVYATEDRQRIALELLRGQRNSVLLGMCADRVYPSPRGIEFGSGALAAMLAYAADVTPIFTGKPEAIFFHELCQRLDVEPSRCLLIGDNLESDIFGGNRVGMTTILTLTGVATRADLPNLPADRQPHAVITDLRELL